MSIKEHFWTLTQILFSTNKYLPIYSFVRLITFLWYVSNISFDHFICRLLPESLNDDECMDGYFTTSFCGNLQHKLWNLLENPNSSFAAKVRHFASKFWSTSFISKYDCCITLWEPSGFCKCQLQRSLSDYNWAFNFLCKIHSRFN